VTYIGGKTSMKEVADPVSTLTALEVLENVVTLKLLYTE
jgi:hypothetical protein